MIPGWLASEIGPQTRWLTVFAWPICCVSFRLVCRSPTVSAIAGAIS